MNIIEIKNCINLTQNIDLNHVYAIFLIDGIQKKYFNPILHPLINFIQENFDDRYIYYDVIGYALSESSPLDYKHFAFSEKIDSDLLAEILSLCSVEDELIDHGHTERSISINSYIADRVPMDFFNGNNYDKNKIPYKKN